MGRFDIQGRAQPNVYEDNTSQFLQQWWSIFHSDVKPSMAKMGENLPTGAMSSINLSASGSSAWGSSSSDRNQWEKGTPDYTGADSFDNILKKIDSTLASPSDP